MGGKLGTKTRLAEGSGQRRSGWSEWKAALPTGKTSQRAGTNATNAERGWSHEKKISSGVKRDRSHYLPVLSIISALPAPMEGIVGKGCRQAGVARSNLPPPDVALV